MFHLNINELRKTSLFPNWRTVIGKSCKWTRNWKAGVTSLPNGERSVTPAFRRLVTPTFEFQVHLQDFLGLRRY